VIEDYSLEARWDMPSFGASLMGFCSLQLPRGCNDRGAGLEFEAKGNIWRRCARTSTWLDEEWFVGRSAGLVGKVAGWDGI
jgi:hypothetical protein